jgi:hypothetical protein
VDLGIRRREEQKAVAYHRDARFIFGTYWQTTQEVPLERGPYVVLGDSASDEELGNAALNALSRYRTGIAPPSREELNALPTDLFKAAGVRSLKEFILGSRLVGLRRTGNCVRLEPTANGGRSRGYESLGGHIDVTLITPANVGKALREAFAESR